MEAVSLRRGTGLAWESPVVSFKDRQLRYCPHSNSYGISVERVRGLVERVKGLVERVRGLVERVKGLVERVRGLVERAESSVESVEAEGD